MPPSLCLHFLRILRPALIALIALPALAATPPGLVPASARIPLKEFSADALGVHPGQTKPVTEALQKALDHVASEGGGKLTVSPGTYIVGPVKLTSRLDLHLAAGVILRLLPRDQNYPLDSKCYGSLFSASGSTDLRISGPGKIDGQGEAWWRAYRAKELTARRPQIISLENCERVELDGISILNPPNTHVSLSLCKEVTIRNIVLEAPDDSSNTDGLNISGKNYLITGCKISTGDDNIAIITHSAKDWPAPVSENFTIRDCTFGYGHGLSIGSYTAGGIRNVLAERCTFDGTTSGIRMKAARDRGGLVEKLVYRDITMRGVKTPVFISSYYPKEPKRPELDEAAPVTASTPRWNDITIANLDVKDSQRSIVLWGLPEMPIGAITFRNATFATREGAKLYQAPKVTLDKVIVKPENGPAFETWPGASSPKP